MANEKKKCMYTEGHYTDEDNGVTPSFALTT